MILKAFRIQMYKCVLDSGWVEVSPLTVLVGKNEAGKTTLLKALHKLNPFKPEPYSMDREWPRGHRKERNDTQIVCTARFGLAPEEVEGLSALTDQKTSTTTIEVTRDYGGRLEVAFPEGLFPDRLHPNDIDEICATLPALQEPVGEAFRQAVEECRAEVRRLAHEGRFTDLSQLQAQHTTKLQAAYTPNNPAPQHQHEEQYLGQHAGKLQEVSQRLLAAPSMQKKAHEYVVTRLPTFIYMSDYRAFTGTAQLDQVKQRKDRGQASEEDRTLVTIMDLAGLDLEAEVKKGGAADREQRQYDLDDASATLTREISERWKQRRYEVQFRGDGQLFYTFVKDERDLSLIRLEERSKGFQWFFSFDLMFMYESKGTFKGCVILLDEPGLHLHPDAQRDLLVRMEEYAKENVLIYTTHLPFMIDLRRPERIRVLSETDQGTVVSADLTKTQPEARFVLQAALGMSGSSSYLVAQQNLVVEGVDDYWILTELSRLLQRSGEIGLPIEVLITPAGGASEAAYIATFMTGQKLDVVVLLDSDKAGDEARDALVKKWIVRYQASRTRVLSLGEVAGAPAGEFAIEDMLPENFYLERVERAYKKDLAVAGVEHLQLVGSDRLEKRVERALAAFGIKFNKGSVAKMMREDLIKMANADGLPAETRDRATNVFAAIREALGSEA